MRAETIIVEITGRMGQSEQETSSNHLGWRTLAQLAQVIWQS
jgi:hypothetical protein